MNLDDLINLVIVVVTLVMLLLTVEISLRFTNPKKFDGRMDKSFVIEKICTEYK